MALETIVDDTSVKKDTEDAQLQPPPTQNEDANSTDSESDDSDASKELAGLRNGRRLPD